mmetsp:Transcript_83748/g.260229  ORF Transcript_83748/g.260229 Transcript_83748/m.260229 type:complete len:136 (-) Transcript_83748:411-818(-)
MLVTREQTVFKARASTRKPLQFVTAAQPLSFRERGVATVQLIDLVQRTEGLARNKGAQAAAVVHDHSVSLRGERPWYSSLTSRRAPRNSRGVSAVGVTEPGGVTDGVRESVAVESDAVSKAGRHFSRMSSRSHSG